MSRLSRTSQSATEAPRHLWAVAAVALFSRDAKPLFIRTFTSPREVLDHPEAEACANLYVGEEDVVRINLLLFSSLDRCNEIVRKRQKKQQRDQQDGSSESRESSSTQRSIARMSAGTDARFLGKLMRSYMFTTYGFQSASGIRTLLAVVGDAPVDAVLPLCRSTYEAASAALCNPFRLPRMHAQLVQRWCKCLNSDILLPPLSEDNMRAAPTPDTMTEEPSLAMSCAFVSRLQTFIEPFTTTTRSSIA
ncbi:hypothetical protein TRVL_03073 [Trypanosoma vivax]|nr:hypothetical protein TRVL_03073 [Trypanosoma vivax]